VKRSLREFRLKPSYGEESIRVGQVRYIDYSVDEMTDESTLGSSYTSASSTEMRARFGYFCRCGLLASLECRYLTTQLRSKSTQLN
jgi:hypothetical protein